MVTRSAVSVLGVMLLSCYKRRCGMYIVVT